MQWVHAATIALALTKLDLDEEDGQGLSDFITDFFADAQQDASGHKQQNRAVDANKLAPKKST